jgi:hypothetical protein
MDIIHFWINCIFCNFGGCISMVVNTSTLKDAIIHLIFSGYMMIFGAIGIKYFGFISVIYSFFFMGVIVLAVLLIVHLVESRGVNND